MLDSARSTAILLALVLCACGESRDVTAPATSNVTSAAAEHLVPGDAISVDVFASGLNSPRGLKFGPDGSLYVAEGGTGGTMSTTTAQCEQVPTPIGPYTGGFTSRISKISANGTRTTVVGGLPSSQTSPSGGSFVSGVADVAFVGDQLYGIEAAAGCSHGLAGTANTLFRVNSDGSTTDVVDLSAYLAAHPVAHPSFDDLEPDGTWYSMVAVRGDLYAIEPNHGEIDRISPATNAVTRLADWSSEPWWGPTVLAYHGNFFVGNLGGFPITAGTEQVRKLTPAGTYTTVTSGLTTVLGIAFDNTDRMYVLESMPVSGGPGPQELFEGRVERIEPSGAKTVIASGLSFPAGMTFGPDGNLYVSNFGFGAPAGAGQIVRITLH
jgi:hypothetical protein